MITDDGQPFQSIAVLGPGLIGGSVLKAVKSRFPEVVLHAWVRREEAADQLRSEPGLVDLATTDLDQAVSGMDCVILAMPTGAMADVVSRIGVFSQDPPTLVTDVGSVKGPVMQDIAPLVAERGGRFVGSHPMAGSEKMGLEFAEADLFVDAAVILTPDENCPEAEASLEILRRFWFSLGGNVSVLDSDRHDEVVAAISHLPHLLASVLAKTILTADPEAAAFCGSGFRDTTRVSAGPEDMWSGILIDNRNAVLEQLNLVISELETWKGALDHLDREQLRGFLSQARQLRENL